jgi:hypothetical protein
MSVLAGQLFDASLTKADENSHHLKTAIIYSTRAVSEHFH